MDEPVAADDAHRLSLVLARSYPDARCDLMVRDPWDLLVAAILSSRTSEVMVNRIMAVLCEHFCGPEAYAKLDHRQLAKIIAKVPLYQQKSRAIVEAARRVMSQFNGTVPDTMKHLASLPGVGRKTAAVVLGIAFGIPAIAADIHVQRIVRRLGWITRENAVDAERAIAKRFPPHHWVALCQRLIHLGRDHCRPVNPKCSTCPFTAECSKNGVDESR